MLTDLLRPWREGRTWWCLCHICLDPILGTLSFTAMVTLLSLSLGLAVTLPLALPFVWLLFVLAQSMGRVERSRLHALLGLDLPDPHEPLVATSWWRRLVERLGSPTRRREVAYLIVLLPSGAPPSPSPSPPGRPGWRLSPCPPTCPPCRRAVPSSGFSRSARDPAPRSLRWSEQASWWPPRG